MVAGVNERFKAGLDKVSDAAENAVGYSQDSVANRTKRD